MDRSERSLIRAASGGDESAFAALMRAQRERVYRVARRVVGSHETAEDVAQQVFLTMYRKLHTFRGDSQLSTWLYRITMNACYDHLRRERPTRELDFDRLPADGATADGRLASEEALGAIACHIQRLPPKQRMTLTLRLGEELSFKDVARAMGCSVGTAKVNYFHGIRRLREWLGRQEPSDHAMPTV